MISEGKTEPRQATISDLIAEIEMSTNRIDKATNRILNDWFGEGVPEGEGSETPNTIACRLQMLCSDLARNASRLERAVDLSTATKGPGIGAPPPMVKGTRNRRVA
jgi:hypothetical protein